MFPLAIWLKALFILSYSELSFFPDSKLKNQKMVNYF